MSKIDKRDRASLFRARLATAMEERATTQSGLARAVGVDRSTISQLLNAAGDRLPNAQVVAECASSLGVSADWLLGLTDRPEIAAELLASSMAISAAPRAQVDEQLFAWYREAAGYKIRNVPARLPDMLKTPEMLRWEYEPHLGKTTQQAIAAAEEQLDFMRDSSSDIEFALPLFELDSLVTGGGYYRSCPAEVRKAQVQQFCNLHEQLYPSVRIFLYDARALYAAPIIVFGPRMAVLYVGQMYLAFRDRERVAAFTRHFDYLVREASVPAHDLPGHLRQLAAAR